MLPIKTILHPTNFSGPSQRAMEIACGLARDYGAKLDVLHVAAQPVIVYGEGVIPTDPEAVRQKAQEQLDHLDVPAQDVPVEKHLAEGDIVSEILREADRVHADLIVLGTQSRSGLERLFLGSVATEVVRKARCPVLTNSREAKIPTVSPGVVTPFFQESTPAKDRVQEASEESFPASDPPAW